MADKIYKALFVKGSTHTRIKILAAKIGMTIDDFIKSLINKKNGKFN